MIPGPPSGISDGPQGSPSGGREHPGASVIRLVPGDGGISRQPAAIVDIAAVLVAVALACSPLWSGFYNFGVWAPLALAAAVLLVLVSLGARPGLTRYGITGGGALAVLLSLSAASMLWAESKESAWTASNQLALYVVIFAIGVLAVRERRSGRTIAMILGAPALLTSLVIAAELIGGSGQGVFLAGRLNSPMGYINGTAGLLVMGIWPWIALSETAANRAIRAAGLGGAAMIAGTAVLTQSRAIVPAMLVATLLVMLAAPMRARRAVNLIVVAVAVALGLHWTLEVYASSGPAQALSPPDAVLRDAGLAIVAGAVFAAVAKLALSSAVARLAPEPRERVVAIAGRVLLGATAVICIAGLIVGHTKISAQYNAFVTDRVNQTAPDRFLDAGGYRYDLWRVASDEFKNHPLGGLGAGNYDAEYYLLRHNPQYVVVPHSLELQMAAELGVGGLLALLVFCGAILTAGFARRGTLAAADPLIRIAALGMFAAWLTATSVDWLYDFPGLAGAAMLAAALLVVPAAHEEAPVARRRQRRRWHRVALVAGLGALAVMTASIGRQYAATRYQAAGAAKVAAEPAAAIRTLQTAEQLDPYSLTTLYDLAAGYAALDDYSDARATLLAAERREPQNYVPPALLGDLATRRGDYGTALAAYTRAQRLDPYDPYMQSLVGGARARISAATR